MESPDGRRRNILKRIFQIFPYRPLIANLQLTEVGEYSATRAEYAWLLVSIIRHALPKGIEPREVNITEACGGIGGDTIPLGMTFQNVLSFEPDEKNHDVLVNNIKCYGLHRLDQGTSGRVTVLQSVYLPELVRNDVLYIDPPWGGPDYKTKHELNVFLDRVPIDIIVERAMPFTRFCIILKLPVNYMYANLERFSPEIRPVVRAEATRVLYNLVIIRK